MDAARSELKSVSERLSASEAAKTSLEDSEKRAAEKVEALEKKVATNENVIHWLNRQLTQAQARDPGLKLAAPPASKSINLRLTKQSII